MTTHKNITTMSKTSFCEEGRLLQKCSDAENSEQTDIPSDNKMSSIDKNDTIYDIL